MEKDELKEKKMSNNYNEIPKWIEENKKFFLPPVCNKMMHGAGQLKVFYVGGPNVRKDFHLEEGEELFYMVKGDMNLITIEHGVYKDIVIKEGEIFQLPGKIPHSPQRYTDTVGLVIERERLQEERDCLRYHINDTTNILWEAWFYCEDLGSQLGPIIKKYFASEQHKTGLPIPGTITSTPPWVPDTKRTLEKPFKLSTWLSKHKTEIEENGSKRLFDLSYQSDIVVLGKGYNSNSIDLQSEAWLWQLEGTCVVKTEDGSKTLKANDSLLVKPQPNMGFTASDGSFTLQVVMDPVQKPRGFAHLTETTKITEQ